MSGGSFDYVSTWAGDLSELINRNHQLTRMAEAVEAEFPDTAAARDLRRLADEVRLLACGEHWSRGLSDVMHAMEWWYSGDWGKDSAQREVDAYSMRNVNPQMSWVPDNGS